MPTRDANKKIRLIMELRRAGVTDMAVLGALEGVDRTAFVPAELRGRAWEDTALPIGCGQTISQPLVVATMTAALELGEGDRVLEVGTGCGYQAAVLAKLVRRVTTIERWRELSEAAEARLEAARVRNVTCLVGDGMQGWPPAAPFDRVVVTAAARHGPPEALLGQIKDGGRMVIPVGPPGEQVLRLYVKGETTAVRDLMPVRFVPLLPDVAG